VGLYSMRAGKDSVLFRLASVARSCGFTPNMMTALGLCFVVAGGLGLVSSVQIMFTLLQKNKSQNP